MNTMVTIQAAAGSHALIIEPHINVFIETIVVKESSKNTYKIQLTSFAVWLHKKAIHTLTPQTIIDYRTYLKKEKHFSDHSVNGYLAAVRSLFTWLESKNLCADIAATIHNIPIHDCSKKVRLTNKQIKRILNTINRTTLEGKRDFALISLMFWTGLRCSQIARLLRGDIAHCCSTQLLWLHNATSHEKAENIRLPDRLFKLIMEYLDARESTSDAEPLFASHSKKNFGQSLTSRSVARIVTNRLKQANIMSARISSIRYTAAGLDDASGNH